MSPSASSDRQTYRVLSALVLALSLMSPSFDPWTSPALSQMQCPGLHRGLSSGPCKPRRPLFTLQPNGYAKLPFMCHRHDRHKRPRLLSSRRRTQAFCSGTRQLAWLLSLCSRRENRPPPLLPPLRKVSYHSGRPFAFRRGDGSLHLQHPTTKHECCICTVVSLQSVYVRGRGAKTDLEQQPTRRTPPYAPTHRASGSLACQPEHLQTLRRYPLGTCRRGGASRACELQPGRGMRRSCTLCPISRTSTDQVIQDLADMLGSVSTAYVSSTSSISPTCGASVQRATSKNDLSCLDRR